MTVSVIVSGSEMSPSALCISAQENMCFQNCIRRVDMEPSKSINPKSFGKKFLEMPTYQKCRRSGVTRGDRARGHLEESDEMRSLLVSSGYFPEENPVSWLLIRKMRL